MVCLELLTRPPVRVPCAYSPSWHERPAARRAPLELPRQGSGRQVIQQVALLAAFFLLCVLASPGRAQATSDPGAADEGAAELGAGDPGEIADPGRPGDAEDPCAGIPFEGCCVENSVRFCDETQVLQTIECVAGPCGWSGPDSYYDCGTEGLADPSGAHPYTCPGATCAPDCAGRACGPDGCGGECGECAAGQICDRDTFVCEEPRPCGAVGAVGCCDGLTLLFCGDSFLEDLDCGALGGVCTWDSTQGFYVCGDIEREDPSGLNPRPCTTCERKCAGRACGDDGCGGTCGICGAAEACVEGVCTEPSGGMDSDAGFDAGTSADPGRGGDPGDAGSPGDSGDVASPLPDLTPRPLGGSCALTNGSAPSWATTCRWILLSFLLLLRRRAIARS